MSIYNIVTKEDKLLRKTCKPVPEITPNVKKLLDNMLETMYQSNGVGLAAPQVGILKRLVVVDVGEAGPGPLKLINPEVLERSGVQDGPEGCPSIQTGGVRFLQHLQQLNLLTGRAGKEPVLQAAEGIRQHLLLRCGEADNACRLEIGSGLVEVVNVNGEVRNAALAGRHERACGRLDQLEQETAKLNERQLLLAVRGLHAVALENAAADVLVECDALLHIRCINGDMAQALVMFLHG